MAKKSKKQHDSQSKSEILLNQPLTLRGVTLRNRTILPPMCMYSVTAQDGRPNNFHYEHYMARANGGFGMIILEATAVAPNGRISPCDLGLWSDDQIDSYRWIVEDMKKAGAVPAIQLNHAGRKASTGCAELNVPYHAHVPEELGGWEDIVGPSPIAYGDLPVPRELTVEEIHAIEQQFRDAAWRAATAGFEAIEIHAAHGYLLNQFLDPLINHRTDEYGGSFENRARMLMETVDLVRGVIPETMPVLVRISATDWAKHGWNITDSVRLSRELKCHGVDMIDVSTGGVVPVSSDSMPVGPGYQVPFSTEVHKNADIPTTAVGLITKAKQAEKILAKNKATTIEIGRRALAEPSWPILALAKLGVPKEELPIPVQYQRGIY